MNKAVFLDRDGTLNEDKGYNYRIEDFNLLEGVIEGLGKLRDNYKLFIITNQSGIGRGYYTEEDMHNYNDYMLREFKKYKINIEKIYFCPHKPKENCNCRKPSSKFIKEAKKEFIIDLDNSYVIGDKPSDIYLSKNSGCKGIYLLTGKGVKHLEEVIKIKPNYVAANFKQATDYILSGKDKVIKREKISGLVNQLKKEGKKIITLNGTFDILHIGHEKILKEAKNQGDILFVGINSDSSVKRNKGINRPINNEENRAKMVANFDFVDYTIIFNEKTPINFLEEIKPDIHVNGSEYGERCIESETVKKNGGRIHIVELIEGYSTTNIIEGKRQ